MRPLSTLDRRSLLRALAVTPLAAAVPQAVQAEITAVGLISSEVSMQKVQHTDEPFELDPTLVRSNIQQGQPGFPMLLRLQVVSADCSPVVGARVDVWHCDAKGSYAGAQEQAGNSARENVLRGSQFSDAAGVVAFQSIFPGWYPGRTTHIHYRVWLDGETMLTGQVFFNDAVSDAIYEDHSAYARANARDMHNTSDRTAVEAGEGAFAQVKLSEPDGHMDAALVVGVSADGPKSSLLDWLLGSA